jgi:hypothetical protein
MRCAGGAKLDDLRGLYLRIDVAIVVIVCGLGGHVRSLRGGCS